MRKYTRTCKTAASIVLLVLLALFGAILLNRRERSRAERLVAQLRQLDGATAAINATQLIRRFRGQKVELAPQEFGSGNVVLGISPCSDADAIYGINVGPTYKLNRIAAYFPGLGRFGLHPWDTGASLFFKNQKLICFSQTVRTWRPNGDAIFAQAYMIFLPLTGSDDAKTYNVSSMRLRGNIYRLEASVSSKSTPQERERAFTIDLRCVTSSTGCVSPAEIMPQSWQRYLQTSATTGDPMQ